MNIYIRYFDRETLVHSVDEAIEFLDSISEITVTPQLINDIRAYMESDMPYPKRYKVRPRVYFILIKCNAETIEEFRANNKKIIDSNSSAYPSETKDERMQALTQEQYGWYRCTLGFKRVIQIPETYKFQYQDSELTALIKGETPLACYNRALDYLQSRQDIDSRSQFPSPKNTNFVYEFLGDVLTEEHTSEIPLESLTNTVG